jgi:tetratricopeptide (TPR) repeat protein
LRLNERSGGVSDSDEGEGSAIAYGLTNDPDRYIAWQRRFHADLTKTNRFEQLKFTWILNFGNDKAAYREIFTTVPYYLQIDDEVTREYRNAVRLKPDEASFHRDLAILLFHKKGELREAIAEHRKGAGDRVSLAYNLVLNNRFDEALSEVREVLRDSTTADDHTFLGSLLQKKGETQAAFDEFRQAFLLTDDCRDSVALTVIAGFLHMTGTPEKEISVFRERIRSHPEDTYSIARLGEMFQARGKFEEEIAVYRGAIRLKPSVPKVHGLFSKVLKRHGKPEQARIESETEIALYREAIGRGEVESALADIREALRPEPRNASYLDSLGWAQLAHGELKESLANVREADRLEKSSDPEIQIHLKLVERLSALESRVDSILQGQDVPAGAEGKLDVARLCRFTRRFAASAKFYRDALQAKPGLANDLTSQHRLHAAIAAAQAGTAPTRLNDDIILDDAEWARWRAQGLDWLRAQRDACAKIITPAAPAAAGTTPAVPTDPPNLSLARKTLDIMTHHRDLACVRDEKELAKLPEQEQKQWQVFWSEVATLLKKADRN